ncbi:MAG TPA: 2-C-methyl-D-erythritol 2,4-cyclodiphosphate synthase [Treponema sp.]|nr:2-C-methyl-D-erythritol 2,4-cyclodiphosphate synthase [Treponema sp.]
MNGKLFLVLLAAGSSSRMGTGKKKEYMELGSGTVLSTALKNFLCTFDFETTLVVTPQGQAGSALSAIECDKEASHLLDKTHLEFVAGGSTRQASVFNALTFLHKKNPPHENSIVLIHDAARPFVSQEVIRNTVETATKYGAAVPAIPPVDTQKEMDADGTIRKHLVRSELCAVQTPQAFLLEPLFLCHQDAAGMGKEYTDDSEIWDAFPSYTGGKKIRVCKGDAANKKITFLQDIETKQEEKKYMIRIGFGTDLHRLVKGRSFFLGGVQIPCELGEEAHSDGDVLLHAITDALLGAAAMGDIGSYFPPEDAKWKDADSKMLLATVWKDIQDKGWSLNNLDCVVETEKPKFLPWREKVIESIAAILGVESSRVFVKAKTNEKLDSVGRSEAIKAYCTCLLIKD